MGVAKFTAVFATLVASLGFATAALAKDWDDILKDRRKFIEKQREAERDYWKDRRDAERDYWKDVREWQEDRYDDWWDDDRRRVYRYGYTPYRSYYSPPPFGYYGGYYSQPYPYARSWNYGWGW